ncbi:MAG: hypothetical protein CMF39_00075 [Legionellaceae bacterium]|nr:hypothetical protein [Legionellaceae bacterium]
MLSSHGAQHPHVFKRPLNLQMLRKIEAELSECGSIFSELVYIHARRFSVITSPCTRFAPRGGASKTSIRKMKKGHIARLSHDILDTQDHLEDIQRENDVRLSTLGNKYAVHLGRAASECKRYDQNGVNQAPFTQLEIDLVCYHKARELAKEMTSLLDRCREETSRCWDKLPQAAKQHSFVKRGLKF